VFDGKNGSLRALAGFSVAPPGEIGTPPRVSYRGLYLRLESVGSNPFLRREGLNPSKKDDREFQDSINRALALCDARLQANPNDVQALYAQGVSYGLRGNYHFLVRKAGHLTEYAILATLAARAFRNSSHQFITGHWFKFSLLLAIGYALTDEFHQSFVPSRTASIHDSLIDSAGALIALSVIWFSEKRRVRARDVSEPRAVATGS